MGLAVVLVAEWAVWTGEAGPKLRAVLLPYSEFLVLLLLLSMESHYCYYYYCSLE